MKNTIIVSSTETHDLLTGLFLRKVLKEKVTLELEQLKQNAKTHTFCLVGLDQFRYINYNAIHSVADNLLKLIGTLITNEIPATDVASRIGGDEFGLLFFDCDLDQAKTRCQRLLEMIAATSVPYEGQNFQVNASVGLVPFTVSSPAYDKLLQQAKNACAAAKRAGGNQILIYHPDHNIAS